MTTRRNIKKIFISSLIPLINACCPSSPCQWQSECAIACNPNQSSARMYLCPANEFAGLELEFVVNACELRLYLNVFGLEIPPDPCDTAYSRVYISFRDHSYTFLAQRFIGGQRLLIPEKVQEEIIDYLQRDQPVFIQVDRYQSDIYPENFLKIFSRMISVLN